MNSKFIAVILAGGIGSRFGSSIPKQFLKINNKMIIDYSIDIFKQFTNNIVIVCDDQYKHLFENYYVISPGEERYLSLDNAMNFIKKKFGDDFYVITHDSARPLIKLEQIKKMIDNISSNEITTLAKKSTSTYSYNNNIINRDNLIEILTPQIIKVQLYYKTHILNNECTDLFTFGYFNNIKTNYVFTQENNIKLTYKPDFDYVRFYLGENNG